MFSWDSSKYLEFEKERTQPAIDLVNHIRGRNVAASLDVGCGPGNSSAVVKEAFPGAEVLGIDCSSEMIASAREKYPSISFEKWDADTFAQTTDRRFDLIFSNACLQWLPDQCATIKKLYGILAEGGILAVQIPVNFGEPVHKLIQELIVSPRWKDRIKPARSYTHFSSRQYYDCIASLTDRVKLWTTVYHHVLPSHEAIVSWYEGTGLRPFSSQLEGAERESFLNDFLEGIRSRYPAQHDGRVIFDFPRLFFTAEA